MSNDIELPELLPCPFCGGAVHWCEDADHKCHRIVCDACEYSLGPSHGGELPLAEYRAESAKLWNTRAAIEADRAKRPHCIMCAPATPGNYLTDCDLEEED